MSLDGVKILSRFDNPDGDRCPKCSLISQNFQIVGENVLACLECGTLFNRKAFRLELKEGLKDLLLAQKAEEVEAAKLAEMEAAGYEAPPAQGSDVSNNGTADPLTPEEPVSRAPAHMTTIFTCPKCGRQIKGKAGFTSHTRACKGL